MAQNIYDDQEFFDAYARLRRSVHGLDAAPEWPTLQRMLPDLAGSRVVDLGCGYGWFCRWAADQGASEILGIDVSARMLERARNATDDPRIDYRQGDMEKPDLGIGSFEVAYSSLALHYLPDLDPLFADVYTALEAGGRFVFSVEHPIVTAPSEQRFRGTSAGRQVWQLDGYLDEGERVTEWLTSGVIKYHRTIETYVGSLLSAGFGVTGLIEWGPSDAQIADRPELAPERERPAFLLVGAQR